MGLNSIIKIIKSFFIKKKDRLIMLEESNGVNEIEIDTKPKTNISDNDQYKMKKEEFFEIYNKAKTDYFNPNSVDDITLSKIIEMMEEELKIKQELLTEKMKEWKKIRRIKIKGVKMLKTH